MTRNDLDKRDRHLAYHLRRLEDEILFYRDPPKTRKKERVLRTRHYLIENGAKRKKFKLGNTRQHRRRRQVHHHEPGINSSKCAAYLILFGIVGGLLAYTMWPNENKMLILDECSSFHEKYQNRTNLTELASPSNYNASDTCSRFATCIDPDEKVKNDVTCTCIDGFFGNGKNCTDYDECGLMTFECQEKEVCKNVPGNYTCEMCSTGWIKETESNYCSDINECVNATLFDCGDEDSDLVCNNNDGSYSCDGCHTGYIWDLFAGQCVDIDECQSSAHDCNLNADCTNVEAVQGADKPVGFECSCKTGYTGTGYVCSDIDECDKKTHDCPGGIECVNTEGSFTCQTGEDGMPPCMEGWSLNFDGLVDPDAPPCQDIDECRDRHFRSTTDFEEVKFYFSKCRPLGQCSSNMPNPCNRGMKCENTDGSYECPECMPGWEPLDTTTCQDINECYAGTHSCAKPGGVCENKDGSYNCPRCDDGFRGPDGFNCTDINECEENNPCNVGVDCTNNDGGFHCGDCDEGYYLSPKGVCFDIDECTMGTHVCARPGGICENQDGGHICSGCDVPHFTGDGNTCTDVNECEEPLTHCTTYNA